METRAEAEIAMGASWNGNGDRSEDTWTGTNGDTEQDTAPVPMIS